MSKRDGSACQDWDRALAEDGAFAAFSVWHVGSLKEAWECWSRMDASMKAVWERTAKAVKDTCAFTC